MALNIDWTPTNRAINQLMYLMGQKQLSEQTHRQALIRERERQSGYEALGRAEEERKRETMKIAQEYDKELAMLRLHQDIQKQAPLDFALGKKNRLLEAGKDDEAIQVVKGILPDVMKVAAYELKNLGMDEKHAPDLALSYLLLGSTEPGTTVRKAADIRMEEARLKETTAERLRKEGEVGKETQADYQKYVAGLRDDALAFLDKVLKSPDDYLETDEAGKVLDIKAKEAFASVGVSSISPKDIRSLMAKITTIADKARRTQLNPDEMDLLLKVYSLEDQLTGLREKKLPGMAYSPEGKALTEKVQREIEAAPTTEEIAGIEGIPPEQAVNVLAGMIMQKARAKGIEMGLEEAMTAAARLLKVK